MLLLAAAFAQDAHVLRAASADATSYLTSNWAKYEENYHPNYVLDGNPATAWVEGVDGDGAGQAITWTTSAVASVRTVTLRIRNGYQKSEALFKANGAPQEVRIRVHGGVEKTVTLTHTLGWQEVTIDNGGLPMRGITLTIDSTYPGTKYLDTCLSDVEVRVDSDVPYNAAAEAAKQAQLDAWVKERVEEAKYFASLPADYPFASSRFSATRTPMIGAEWAAAARELQQRRRENDDADPRYRLQVTRPIRWPEGLYPLDRIGGSEASGSPVPFPNLLRTSDFSRFEATGEVASQRGAVHSDEWHGESGQTTISTVRGDTDLNWTAQHVFEERGIYTFKAEYLLCYTEGRLTQAWLGTPGDPTVGTIVRVHWDDKGHVDSMELLEAREGSAGDAEFEPDFVAYHDYTRTVLRAQ